MKYFTSENWLKTYGVITPNVDAGKITPLIQFSAKAYVQPMLGSVFFNDLLTKYNAQTLSTDEETLVSKMQFAIGFRACAQAVITLSYQLTNKGIVKQTDDNATFGDLTEVKYMYTNYESQAVLYESELKKYLLDNKDLFPVFLGVDNKDSSLKNDENDVKGDDFLSSTGFMFI